MLEVIASPTLLLTNISFSPSLLCSLARNAFCMSVCIQAGKGCTSQMMQITIYSPVTQCKDISVQFGLTSPLCICRWLCPRKHFVLSQTAIPVRRSQVPQPGDKAELCSGLLLHLRREGNSLPPWEMEACGCAGPFCFQALGPPSRLWLTRSLRRLV